MAVTERDATPVGAVLWAGLAIIVGLWWSLAQLELVPFDWLLTAPLALLALAVSMYLSVQAS